MNLLANISSYFPSLTKSEQKVAQFVLANPDEIETVSIQQLAKKTKVGESTIVRFARKIGFDGYQEFKLALVKNQLQETSIESGEDQGVPSTVHKQIAASLNETRHFLNERESDLDRIAKKLAHAESIYLFAVGNSGTVAQDCANRFLRIGKKAIFHSDPHIQAINASVMTEKDVALAVSVSGNTQDVLLNLKLAADTGASIVAITNYLNSGVTKMTEDVVICSSREYSSVYGSFASKVAQLYAIDVLFHKLVDLDKKQIQSLRDQTNNALIDRIH